MFFRIYSKTNAKLHLKLSSKSIMNPYIKFARQYLYSSRINLMWECRKNWQFIRIIKWRFYSALLIILKAFLAKIQEIYLQYSQILFRSIFAWLVGKKCLKLFKAKKLLIFTLINFVKMKMKKVNFLDL